jgi:hypothetical protein
MRYQGSFPARDYLEQVPEDFMRFLRRCEEMGDTGTVRLKAHGHALQGPRYRSLFQFNMEETRSWGFRYEHVYIVLNAAQKNSKNQEPDYETALELRADYLNGPQDD